MTNGAMRFFTSDEEIAFAIAHEMRHNLLGYVGSNQSYEYESDYMARHLMERADYNVRHDSNFFRRLASEDPKYIPIDRRGVDPYTALRIILLKDLYTEIKKKKYRTYHKYPA
jgi:predicted Zn-dependent protease